MMKQNKIKIVITSLIIMIPMLTGIILWKRLPDTLAIHFGPDNTANGWGSKMFTVFAIPLILTSLHVFCITVTSYDSRKNNIGKKTFELTYWIIPIISLFMYAVVYAMALGHNINIILLCNIFFGIMLIVFGNLLPKVKPNFLFGIRLPWILRDSENWNRTHRIGGWSMVTGGIVLLTTALLCNIYITLPVLVLSVGIPTVYSYIYYRRNISSKK